MKTITALISATILLAGCVNYSPEVLMITDRNFSDRSKEAGMQKAFLEFADDSAVILRENALPIVGKATLAESFSGIPDTGFVLTWEPLAGHISGSGDLGYTYGIFTTTINGDSSLRQGTYVTIWKKQEDGSWKWVLDTGNQGIGQDAVE